MGEIIYRGGDLYPGGLILKKTKTKFSERQNKMYLRNKLKLTYHYILSFIYNTFITCITINREFISKTFTKPTYICNCIKRNTKEHTYTVDGLVNRGLISRIIYSLANGWAYIQGGLEPGGWALKWDFMVCKALKKKTSY